jgi:1-phosphofructokinase
VTTAARIATVTLNPAVDQRLTVPGFRAGQVNRVERMDVSAGGKGVNVATVLAGLGLQAAASGFLGAENADLFERHLARYGIEDRFVRLPGSTRVGIKILGDTGETTDLNFPGLAPQAGHLEQLFGVVAELARSCRWLVLSGSVPPGVPKDVYGALVERVRAGGCEAALDTSGEPLRKGLAAGPGLVKPNAHELGELLGRSLEGVSDVAAAAQGLLERGIPRVVVSMGSDGAVFVDRDAMWLARPPKVEVLSTVGAGDAMVAGTVAGLAAGKPLGDCARLATALAAAAVTRLEAGAPSVEALEALEKQVVLERLQTRERR